MEKQPIFFLTKFKPLYFLGALLATLINLAPFTSSNVFASYLTEGMEYMTCTDIKFVFARGSGAEVNSERDFVPFKNAVDAVFGGSEYSYSFYELGSKPGGWEGYSYPAPGIGISSWARFETSIGALMSGGEMHAYGNSVEDGSIEASYYTLALKFWCPNTKIVYAGYSQGAQVISRTLQQITPENMLAALTFGDPKLYLPEGKTSLLNLTPAACRNEKLSEYRAYVPDCYAYQGILGGYQPYQASSEYSGKLKAYCQYHDVICSSFIDLDNLSYGHASYDEQGTYLRGVQDVYNMLKPGTYSRPAQNLAVLFDTTGSMGGLINQYKSEATRAAKKILSQGGKVALYTYGDLNERNLINICDFETCTIDNIEGNIKSLKIGGGGDIPESLLSASYNLMQEVKWEIGANKSLIVLTDAPFHNPDRDGITLEEVVELSKSIDPVNFYILTDEEVAPKYEELAKLTDGGVYTSNIDSAFADIEEEYSSRKPSELYVSTDLEEPIRTTIDDLKLEKTSESSVKIDIDTDATLTILSINDYIAGYTEEKSIEITDLNLDENITFCFAPVSSNGYRDESACVSWTSEKPTQNKRVLKTFMLTDDGPVEVVLPKAPDTGKAR